MSELWTSARNEDGRLPEGSVSITDVHYEFDEPLIFSGKFGPMDCLFVKVRQRGGASYFLASETKYRTVKEMTEGRLSVYGALLSERFWLLSKDDGKNFYKYWGLSPKEVPPRFLPKPGKALHHWFGSVPDSLAQAEGVLSLKYKGQALEENGMPLAKLKALIDQSSKAVRKMLAPLALQNSRTSTFDVKVAPLEFASLVVSVQKPSMNIEAIRRTRPDEDILKLHREFYDRAEFVARGLAGLNAVRGTDKFNDEYARENFAFLSSLLDLLPSEDDFFSSTEVSARSGDKIIGISFDKEQSKIIRNALHVATQKNVTEIGLVGGYIEKSQVVRLQSSRGKEVTCRFKAGEFEKITKDPQFGKGRRIKISGKLTIRARVDLLEAVSYEFI